MTKKDYELLAAAVRAALHEAGSNLSFESGVIATAEKLADRLALDNQRFDRARFIAACGIED